MGRTPIVAAAALVAIVAAGCGGSSSAPQSRTTAAMSVTAVEWLASSAKQWNNQLNSDQNDVDSAASATSGATSATFFARLSSACTKMLHDAEKAKAVPHAPTRGLQQAWAGMVSATGSYASRCMELVRSRSNSDLAIWENSLKSMNAANATWNAAVSTARNAASTPSG